MSRFLLSEHPQNTPEWYAVRAGKVTGSKADCLLSQGKGGAESTGRRNYRAQLAVERILGRSLEEGGYESPGMRAGKENEPFARLAYEAQTGELAQEAGFAYLPNMAAGCSVDGFIGDDGILECKCPNHANHIEYLQRCRIPPEYVPQVTHNLYVTGRQWVDFVSYNPQMPEYAQLLIVRMDRSEAGLPAYELALNKFLGEVGALEEWLRAREQLKAAA